MLTGGGETTKFMYNGLKSKFDILHVVIEQNVPRKKIIKNRIKRLGYITVIGQVLFQLIVPRFLKLFSASRIEEIKEKYNIDSSEIPDSVVKNFDSVNSKQCRAFIKEVNPDLIIVNGTRIISKKVLNSTNAIFINTHVGITPRYRGVHGGYWAMVNDDLDNCGVTVHLVDAGIDTGGVLFQETIQPTPSDNFLTYPYMQVGEGIKLMAKAIEDFSNGILEEDCPMVSDSKLYYHPTIWTYILNRVKGIK